MCSLLKRIAKIRQGAIEMKSQQNTQADSARWHRLTLDLGSPTTDYGISYLHTIRVRPKDGIEDNLIIYPSLAPGQTRWYWSMGGYSATQYSSVGRVQFDFTDERTIYVINNTTVGGFGDTPTVLKNIVLTIYSNHGLELIENSKTQL